MFKQNGDYYPSDRFTPNKDNTGVTLKGGYEYDETGKLVAQKAVSNPKGNLVSKRDEGKTNPFAGTSNSGEEVYQAIEQDQQLVILKVKN